MIAEQIDEGTLPNALRQARAIDGGAPFLLTADQDWTYEEIDETSTKLAAGLLAIGLRPGERIAIAAPNCAEWIITWLAAAKLGASLVTLNVAYREREFGYMLNQSGAAVLVCVPRHRDFDFIEFLDQMRLQLTTVREYVFLGSGGFADNRSWDWDAVLSAETNPETSTAKDSLIAGADHEISPHPDDPAVILYTSGTTGDPKGATLTHRSILASARAQAAHLDQHKNDIAIGHMPLNHVGGLTCTVAAAIVSGGSVALLPGFDPKEALRTIAERQVSIFLGVPTMYSMMMRLEEFPKTDTSSVRICIVGGSNVEPEMGRTIIDAFDGARLANLYGLSESSGGCIISAADDDLDTLIQTIGVPIGTFCARVVDAVGEPIPAGEEGELQIKGPCVASGYWENPEASRAAFLDDGWLATGDMAAIRRDGRVSLRGRSKEMYVRGGENVYPAEIENVIAGDPAVAMSAVIGIPHEVYGEVGRAYLVPAADAQIDIDSVLERCRNQLAKYKVPESFEIVESLPLTPAGKIKKIALLETFFPARND